jgi:hypothetical protein
MHLNIPIPAGRTVLYNRPAPPSFQPFASNLPRPLVSLMSPTPQFVKDHLDLDSIDALVTVESLPDLLGPQCQLPNTMWFYRKVNYAPGEWISVALGPFLFRLGLGLGL